MPLAARSAQPIEASVMIRLTARAQRPHCHSGLRHAHAEYGYARSRWGSRGADAACATQRHSLAAELLMMCGKRVTDFVAPGARHRCRMLAQCQLLGTREEPAMVLDGIRSDEAIECRAGSVT